MLRKAAHEQRQSILLLELLETFTSKHSLRLLRTGSKQSEVPDSPARMAAAHLIIFLTPDLDNKLVLASRRV